MNRRIALSLLTLAGALASLACQHPVPVYDLDATGALKTQISPYRLGEGEEAILVFQNTDITSHVKAVTRREAAKQRGRELFRKACATCHGFKGNGKGPSAAALDPKPRDFTRGAFKWRSTVSGALPLDGDIFRTISEGVPGTMMVSWKNLLSEAQRWDLVEYVKSFSPRFAEEGVYEEDLVEIPDPVVPTPESIARGKEIYEKYQCWQCHGKSGRGDGPSAPKLRDSWDNPIKPFDFTTGAYRCGNTERAIYRTFFTGLNGTPMPSFGDILPEEDRWPLVHYVRSLQRKPGFFERLIFTTP